VATSTSAQQARRARVEGLISLAAPVLDLVLAVGDRVSRVLGPEDDPLPIRPASERVELGFARPVDPPATPQRSPQPSSAPVD